MQFFVRLAVALIAFSWIASMVVLVAIVVFAIHRHRHSAGRPVQR